jgi:hypothetical protein
MRDACRGRLKSEARSRRFQFDRERAAALQENLQAGKEGISSVQHSCQSAFRGTRPD